MDEQNVATKKTILTSSDSPTQLKKSIGFFSALSTVMGTVIGAGVFFKAASVFNITSSASLGMLAWLLGGLISICAGLTGAELAAAIPKTGGMIKYIEHTYGDFTAYLLGWAQTIIYIPANIAALAIIFGTQFKNLFGLEESWIIPIAIISAVSLTLLNFLGSKTGGMIQSVTLVCKLVPLAAIVILGIIRSGQVSVQLFPVQSSPNVNAISALGMGLLATMFAYDGWIQVGTIAGEMKNPQKDLPKSISLGIFLIMLVYLLVNFAFLLTLPIAQNLSSLPLTSGEGAANTIAANPNAAMDVAIKLFGGIGGKIITIGILISVYGTLNGYTMTGMRIPYAMAIENRLPFSKLWAKLTPNSKIPVYSGLLILVIAVIMMFSGQFDTLTDMLVFVIWIFYTLVFLAVFILRKREPDLKRPYKVPLYPFIPAVALLGGLFIIINTLFTQPLLAGTGILLTAIGIPFYLYLKQKERF